MRTRFAFFYAVLLLFVGQFVLAQVTGVVNDVDGFPDEGATVEVKDKGISTTTNVDGEFSIDAVVGEDVLVISPSDGSSSWEVNVTSNNLSELANSVELEEVTVVAQGIAREDKTIGYSKETVSKEYIQDRPTADISQTLQGKFTGVQINSVGGVAGSGSSISVRSLGFITGSNQPLFVVDGVPFDSGTNSLTGFADGGSLTTSRFLDIDPNSIEEVTVLKGLAASNLYGEQGKNGVILITTKNSKFKKEALSLEFNTSTYFSEIQGLPDYQNTYGQGADQTINVGFVGNWGARFDDTTMVRHHYDLAGLAAAFPQYQGAQVLYAPVEDNVEDFFRTGLGVSYGINANGASERVGYNFGFNYTDEDGYVPGNNLKRWSFNVGGKVDVSDKFRLKGSISTINTDFKSPPVSASNAVGSISVFTRTLFIPRNFDLNNLPFQNPLDGSSVYYRGDQSNPLWLVHNAQQTQDVSRYFVTGSAEYDITDDIFLTYRVGYDRYNERQDFWVNKGATEAVYTNGYYRTTDAVNLIFNQDIQAILKPVKLSDAFKVDALLGANARGDSYEQTGISSQEQVLFGRINHDNFLTQSSTDPFAGDLDFRSRQNVIGVYGAMNLSYNNYLFLTLSARNDWTSTVEKENRSLFYPSASASFILTDAFDIKSKNLNFLKLRFGYGTSASFPSPYGTRNTVSLNTNLFGDGNVGNNVNGLLGNPDLKPALAEEFEAGLDAKLWNNKIEMDVSVYQRTTTDQILNRALDPSTGFNSTLINAGEVQIEGIEIGFNANFIRAKEEGDLDWFFRTAFTAYENTVIDLPEGSEEIQISGFSNGIGNYAIEGQAMNVFQGSYAVRDSNGNLLINPNDGKIIASDDVGLPNRILGDPNPDFTFNFTNTVSFKRFTLSAQVDWVSGGDFFSVVGPTLLRRGVTEDTIDRERTYVLPGVLGNPANGEVLLDGNGNTITNTIQIGANDVYFLNTQDVDEAGIYDASRVKLRNVSLSYSFSKKMLSKTGLKGLTLSLTGDNLWYHAFNVPEHTNLDAEVNSTGVGNGQGIELNTAWASKRYGFNVRILF